MQIDTDSFIQEILEVVISQITKASELEVILEKREINSRIDFEKLILFILMIT